MIDVLQYILKMQLPLKALNLFSADHDLYLILSRVRIVIFPRCIFPRYTKAEARHYPLVSIYTQIILTADLYDIIPISSNLFQPYPIQRNNVLHFLKALLSWPCYHVYVKGSQNCQI